MATARVLEFSPAEGVPYIGLRPFEPNERDRFFGRDRDAQLLCDRILSSQLTILYALSGLGKSSLLRALVIPRLEENHARVVYFDTWSQSDPLQSLKSVLATAASQLGIAAVDCASLSLVELGRLLLSRDDRSLVLVFDQFEEFLVRSAQNLDPLRSELSALVRNPKLDVSVVLTLREEFLAALEPFRQQILNLFQSAYRLENLSKEDLGRAIREPAKLFGGDCEETFVDELIKDLEGGSADIAGDPQLSLGLPMLQLVCRELWEQAPGHQLSLALYDKLGRAQHMIDEYVRELMPSERERQNTTADLLIYLAPPSGLKMSYSVEDLAGITSLTQPQIEIELKRLSAAGILRTREYTRPRHVPSVRYELQHDAFIPVLRSWREEVLERKRRRKRRLQIGKVASACLLVLLVLGYGLYAKHQGELNRQEYKLARLERDLVQQKHDAEIKAQMEAMTEQEKDRERELDSERKIAALSKAEEAKLRNWQEGGMLDELRTVPDAEKSTRYFDNVVEFVLNKRGESKFEDLKGQRDEFQDLRNSLFRHQSDIPPNYHNPPPEEYASPDERWPLEVDYPDSVSLDDLNPKVFEAKWRNLATDTVKHWAIPVPFQVRLVPKAATPKSQFTVVGNGSTTEVTVPDYSNLFLIESPSNLGEPAREFLGRFKSEWTPFPKEEGWLLVPRWSAPVWKAAGVTPTAPSGINAYLVFQELVRNPAPIFSPGAVEVLLRHTNEQFPTTVEEAKRARGDKLGSDLATHVREQADALLDLPRILDELADQSDSADQANAAGQISHTSPTQISQSASETTSRRLHGPWREAGSSKTQKENSDDLSFLKARPNWAYMEVEPHLPEFEPPIRVYVGTRLVKEWFPGDKYPAQGPLPAGIEKLRDEMYRANGVWVPGYRFSRPPQGESLDASSIRIRVQRLTGDLERRVSASRSISGPDTVGNLISALRSADERTSDRWITPETVREIFSQFPVNTRQRLEEMYSPTDLKRLMREVVNPNASNSLVHGSSVRYPTWLLNSLLFWNSVEDDPKNLDVMAAHLRQTAELRIKPRSEPVPSDSSPEFRRHLQNGIRALVDNDPGTADSEFQAAKKQDPKATVEFFPVLWSQCLLELWLRDFERTHDNLEKVSLSHAEQMDLRDLSDTLDPQRDLAAWREMSLYNLATGQLKDEQAAATIRNLLLTSGAPETWNPDRASWLALRFLHKYDPLDPQTGDPQSLASASALLESAVRRLDQSRAYQAYLDLVDIAGKQSAPNWTGVLLDRLAAARPGGAEQNLQLERAWELCNEERSERLHRALDLAQNYENIVSSAQLPDDQRQFAAENIRHVRAKSYLGLSRQGEEQYRAQGVRLTRDLLTAREPLARDAYSDLLQILYEDQKDEEAHQLSVSAQQKWPDEAGFLGAELAADFHSGNMTGVESVARLAQNKVGQSSETDKQNKDWLFVAALAGLLSHSNSAEEMATRFLHTNHEYKDYILMIGYAFSRGESSPLAKAIDERWSGINPNTWPERVRNGDASAWREILIGRFKGAALSAKLLDLLRDEDAWRRSDFAQLAQPLRGQRCEAWFYDAMNFRTIGSKKQMFNSLRRSVDGKCPSYYEFAMSSFLLAQEDAGN